jgi:tetratricopeptide (TPR) repeat protein
VYGDELLATLLDMASRPDLARRAFEQYDVELVLVEARGHPYRDRLSHNAGILDTVSADPAWGLLYFDDGAALYARRDARRVTSFLEDIDPRKLTPRTLTAHTPERETTLREATARAPRASLPRYALASLLHARGADAEAMRELETGWNANPRQPAAPALAGRLAEAAGDVEAARRWYQRTLEAGPGWQTIQARLRALEP